MPLWSVLLPALLSACGGPTPAEEGRDAVPATVPADAAPPVPRGIAGHDTTPHTHATTHGGEIKTVGDLHVEGRFMRSGLMVWLYDAAQEPLDLDGVTGTAVVKGPAGVTTVPLAPMGDHLHAALTLPEGTAADAVVTLSVAGTPLGVDFRTSSVGSLAEHDHTSLHGGVVSMWGDLHVEYVARGGEVRFYVTDARRIPVKGDVRGSATIGAVVVPLAYDPATGALSAKATPTGLVTLDVTVGETTFSLAFGR